MFNSLLGLAGDVLKVVTAPVEIVADLTRTVTKPLADAAKEMTEVVKEIIDDN